MDRTYKMVITAYFRAKDSDEANEIWNEGPESHLIWDSYTVNTPIEVHDEKEVGLSE